MKCESEISGEENNEEKRKEENNMQKRRREAWPRLSQSQPFNLKENSVWLILNEREREMTQISGKQRKRNDSHEIYSINSCVMSASASK